MEKHRLLKNKKGFNDIVIIAGLGSILFLTALLIPYINEALDTDGAVYDVDGTQSDIQQASGGVGGNGLSVITTLLKLAFWDFTGSLGLPWWIQAMYTMISVLLVFTVARNVVPFVGGS